MIVVTGGLGFIGQNLVEELISNGHEVQVLDTKTMELNKIRSWLFKNSNNIETIFHLGAITDTTEIDTFKLDLYNYSFSIFLWNLSVVHNIKLIYASSAATYGNGENGFSDKNIVRNLQPLNPYANSKQKFDEFAYSAGHKPNKWYGLKFFNVYGYGESHKGDMASMVYHGYNQIKETGEIKLFESETEPKRDFVYVDDVINACLFFMDEQPINGIYNIGTGKARSFTDLAKSIFKSLGLEEKIVYFSMPENLEKQYQYFTEAEIDKLRNAGYKKRFHSLEKGVSKYIKKLEIENA